MAITVAELAVVLGADVSALTREVTRGTDKTIQEMAKISRASEQTSQALARVQPPAVNTAPVTRLAAAVKDAGEKAKGATFSVNPLRESVASLASQMAGAHPIAGRLATVLGDFAIGSGATVALLAGLAAIAYAFNKIGEESRKAEEASEDARAALARLAGAGGAEAMTATITAGRAEELRLAAQLGEVQRRLRAQTNFSGQGDPLAAALQQRRLLADELRIKSDLAKVTADLAAAERARSVALNSGANELDQERARAAEEALRKRTELIREQTRAADELAKKLEAADRAIAGGLSGLRVVARIPDAPQSMTGAANYRIFAPTASMSGGRDPHAIDATTGRLERAFGLLTEAAENAARAFSPAALAMEVVGSAMVALGPTVRMLLEPVRAVGTLLGAVLLPVLRPVAYAFTYVTQGIGWLIEGIGAFIDKLVGWFSSVGDNLKRVGQEMQEGAKKARSDVEYFGDAARSAAASITNMPPIFDWALRRRMAGMGGVPVPGSGGAAGDDGLTLPGRRNPPIVVNINNPPAGMDVGAVTVQVTRGIVEGLRQGGTSELALALRQAVAA